MLCTGGVGMIGSALVNRLCEQGKKVLVIDDLSRGKQEFLHPQAELLIRDLQENTWQDFTDNFQLHYGRFSACLHLACKIGGVNYMLSNELASHKNAAIDWNVLSYCAERKIPLLYCSTACTYSVHVQTAEADHPPLKENEALQNTAPESIYGYCKLVGELTVARHAKESGLSWKVVRMFNVFGPREVPNPQTGHVIPALIYKCLKEPGDLEVWGTGQQFRSFLYVDDAADGILAVMDKGLPGRPYNLGWPERVTIKELAEMVVKATETNKKLWYNLDRPMGVFGRTADISRVKAEVGWEPKTDLYSGIVKTVEWCKEWMQQNI